MNLLPENKIPRVGITIGDVAGIGPEITVKALADAEVRKICVPVVIGDARLLQNVSISAGLPFDYDVRVHDETFSESFNVPTVIDFKNSPASIEFGLVSKEAGLACADYIRRAVGLISEKKIDAVSTAPINKRALSLAGLEFPGHTEFLAHLSGTKKFAMAFFASELRVVLLSTHLSLRKAIEKVNRQSLIDLIVFADQALSKLLNTKVRIAVAGLNPHASEGGMFGDEEAREIAPAVEHCRTSLGVDVSGPYSPDTVFLRGFRGEFDAVIACYHDQATIAVKSLSFGTAVNVTLGLPFVRTSVDHGTAYDIAGKNLADPSSMKEAIKLAATLVGRDT